MGIPTRHVSLRPIVNYGFEGSGTPEEPACITFNFAGGDGPGLAVLRLQLPPTVVLDTHYPAGYELRGADPAMSRTALGEVFFDLATRRYWPLRSFK